MNKKTHGDRTGRVPSRRLFALLLALTLVLSIMAGCKKEEEPTETTSEPTESTSGETTVPENEKQTERTEPLNGWYVDRDGNVLFYQDDEAAVGFYHNETPAYFVDREFVPGWYYFDENGFMVSGCWIEDSGFQHYITDNGTAAEPGWYSDSKGWYCLREKGQLVVNEVFAQDGANYSVDAEGYLFQVKYDRIDCESGTASLLYDIERECLLLPEPVENCFEFAVTYNVSFADTLGSEDKGWVVWLLQDGQWVDMEGKYSTSKEDGKVTVRFHDLVSFEGCCVFFKVNLYEMEPYLTDLTIRY